MANAVAKFSMTLNDTEWSSLSARAAGLGDLSLAQIGSKGVVDDVAFVRRLVELMIREILPPTLRRVDTPECDAAAERCEDEGSEAAAGFAVYAARTAYAVAYIATFDAVYAVDATVYTTAINRATRYSHVARSAVHARAAASNIYYFRAADAAYAAAYIAVYAARAATRDVYCFRAAGDEMLKRAACLAIRVLRELGSPGAALLS